MRRETVNFTGYFSKNGHGPDYTQVRRDVQGIGGMLHIQKGKNGAIPVTGEIPTGREYRLRNIFGVYGETVSTIGTPRR